MDDDFKLNKNELKKTNPQYEGESDMEGSMPDPEEVNSKSVLDQEHEMGLYEAADEEHLMELNIAEEIAKNRES